MLRGDESITLKKIESCQIRSFFFFAGTYLTLQAIEKHVL